MKKKKLILEHELSEILFSDEKIKISKSNKTTIFEIGKETTTDISEAVCLMMNKLDNNHEIWNTTIEFNSEEIQPERSFYWLTGGHLEWKSLENFIKPWSECYLIFQEEFGLSLINILKKSKNLGEIKRGIRKSLNLPLLYEFALSKNLIK